LFQYAGPSSSESSSDSDEENDIHEIEKDGEASLDNTNTQASEATNNSENLTTEDSNSFANVEISSNKSYLLDESSSGNNTGSFNNTKKVKNCSSNKPDAIKDTETANHSSSTTAVKKAPTFIPVKRPRELAEARMDLPIIAEEQVVMETIKENMMTVIVGPTGSGKTTQVPQFLYEAGYARYVRRLMIIFNCLKSCLHLVIF
jgi:ATP-dependent RNA helicase DHX37/DHR1